MRKNNWIVAAVAAILCGVLLWLWFSLGFNHVDDPLDLVVAVLWWAVVAAVIGAIVWAENRRRERMRTAFLGTGVLYSAELGYVQPQEGQDMLATLQAVLSGMTYPDAVAEMPEKNRPAFRWVVRSKKFDNNGDTWEGEVLPANDPDAEPLSFANRDELASIVA